MSKKVNKLSDLNIDEVSLVDRGANQHAKVLLSKRHDGDDEVSKEDAPSELKNADPEAKNCTACEGKGEVPDQEGGIKSCSVCGGTGEVSKADPDPSSVTTKGGEKLKTETFEVTSPTGKDEEEEEGNKVGKNFFTRLVNKMMGRELTTAEDGAGTLTDMSDVSKAGFGQNQDPQLPFGQQMQGAPAPGVQGQMPGQQAFPAGGMPGAMPGEMQQPGQMQAGPPLPDEVVQYIQQLEQALAQQGSANDGNQEDDVNPFGKSAEDLDQDEVAFLQELSKSLEDEDQREMVNKALETVEKANERAEEAESIAKAERDHRLTQEYVAKARAYTNLPVNPEEFGPVLKRLNEALDTEDVEAITKALSTANESVASYFGEVGKRGIEGYESISKAEAKAEEIVKNSDGSISKEAALAQVFEENPSLYDEHLQESGR